MTRCPKCSYALVLLEKRNKYKCAKCGKLFLRKGLEFKEFREWNENKRLEDKEKTNASFGLIKKDRRSHKQRKLTTILKTFRQLFSVRLTLEQLHKRRLDGWRKYRENNPEKRSEAYKKWANNNKDKRYASIKSWKESNPEKARFKQRMAYWRSEQLKLAKETFNKEFEDSFSTYGLSELLFVTTLWFSESFIY